MFKRFFASSRTTFPQSYALSDRELPLKVVADTRARRLILRIEQGGKGLRVTAPPGIRGRDVERFVDRHRDWLERRLHGIPAPTDSGAILHDGAHIMLFGKQHRIVYVGGRGVAEVAERDGELCLLVYGDEQYLARRVKDFVRKQAERVIAPLVEHYSAVAGRKPKSVRYKDTVSRWGSCSADGHLSFSWRIAMAPADVIRYLVAHEVAHLIEMNHAPQFWALCERLCPGSQQQRTWLKYNGQSLHAVHFG
ncbi:MAG: Hypothetical protein BHV28_00590 [Candidatus Tokpelaia hoelldobleri]|uniref:YgjP-like metallopeptidase domain-containing protein n=1 Tax=Candidatus Tokpelaia hoelldobleri TaxID=1902579 RepID=A0A1U9JSE1_9HYPH|nr:MAG: Hypothetical protein BHV28_00590 [Candidatus Tokpelaia hoelldoblerii]